MIRLWDVHSHAQESIVKLNQHLKELCKSSSVKKISLMGTCPEDWIDVEDAYKNFPDVVVPCFGLHPWFAYRLDKSMPVNDKYVTWREDLRSLLIMHPKAVCGEFGLDRVATTPDAILAQIPDCPKQTFDTLQKEVFEYQFNLAVELQRPISIHLVRAQGYLQDFIRNRCKKLPSKSKLKKQPEGNFTKPDDLFPPKIMLHSYSGSVELIKQLSSTPLIGDRFYVSFSSIINDRLQNLKELIRAVPDDRLLIESDFGDIEAIPELMGKILQVACETKGWSHEEAGEKLWRNSESFYKSSVE